MKWAPRLRTVRASVLFEGFCACFLGQSRVNLRTIHVGDVENLGFKYQTTRTCFSATIHPADITSRPLFHN